MRHFGAGRRRTPPSAIGAAHGAPRPLQIHAGWRALRALGGEAASSPGFLADPDAGDTSDSASTATRSAPPRPRRPSPPPPSLTAGSLAAAAADRRAIECSACLRRWRPRAGGARRGHRARRHLRRARARAAPLRPVARRRVGRPAPAAAGAAHAVVRRRLVGWRAAVARRDRLRSLVRRFLPPKLTAQCASGAARSPPLHLLNARARGGSRGRWHGGCRRRRRGGGGATLPAARCAACGTRRCGARLRRSRRRTAATAPPSPSRRAPAGVGRPAADARAECVESGGGRAEAAARARMNWRRPSVAAECAPRCSAGATDFWRLYDARAWAASLARSGRWTSADAMSSWRALGARWRRAPPLRRRRRPPRRTRAWRRWRRRRRRAAAAADDAMRAPRGGGGDLDVGVDAAARARHPPGPLSRRLSSCGCGGGAWPTPSSAWSAVFAARPAAKVFALRRVAARAAQSAAARGRKCGAAAAAAKTWLVAAMNTWVDAAGAR